MQLELPANARELLAKILRGFAPPPSLKVSEWANTRRILTRSFSAEPGRFSTARTPWVTEPMDCLNDAETEVIVITGGSQVSKSETALNIVGYVADVEPGNILYVTPDDGLAVEFSRRMDDMIEASPALREKFATRRQKGAFFNQTTKSYSGGSLSIVGAGSPSALSARPCRIVIGDEVDRVRLIRNEGDAISLARARQATFYSRKTILVSTPTVAGISRIEAAYAETDQNVWEACCPDCGEHHPLDWQHAQWEPNKANSAVYVAPCCGSVWQDAKRWEAGASGRWNATSLTGKKGWRGFRYPGLASPWVKLGTLAAEFEMAKTPGLKAPFYNLRLGVPFEANVGDGADADVVRSLAENWNIGTIPERRIVLITAGIDVQQTWLAVHIVGWSDGDEAWSLAWHEIPGDPLDPRTWTALEDVLTAPWRHPSGEMLNIEAAAIDSGFQSQAVYEFSAKHRGRRWYAIKGMSGQGRPIWQRGADVHASMSKLHLIGLDLAKAQVASGIVSTIDGPGRWHTPTFIHEQAPHFADWLCSEELVTKDTASGPKSEWRKRKGVSRNEVWDCSVYALAARYSSDFRIPQRIERLSAYGALTQKAPDFAALAKRLAATTT